jgi:glycerol-3-phosphate O-acyltransferase
VNFGEPVSLRSYFAEQHVDLRTLPLDAREAEIAKLGQTLMQSLAKTLPALPVSLVAKAALDAPASGVTAFELKGRVYDLVQKLEAQGAYIHIPRRDREYAIEVGLRMLTLRHLILEDNGQYRINPEEGKLLNYYANAIAPLQDLPAARVRGATAC